jgi:hypothetical protein
MGGCERVNSHNALRAPPGTGSLHYLTADMAFLSLTIWKAPWELCSAQLTHNSQLLDTYFPIIY